MPPVNIYTSKERVEPIAQVFDGLAGIIAKELTCSDRQLNPEDIQLQILVPEITYNSPATRVDIYAAPYSKRVERQDIICTNVQQYLRENCPQTGDVKVFLILAELGYSFSKP